MAIDGSAARVEIRLLVAFLAVADEGHFGRAAARLHLAQPSLSQQIQRLERVLGVRLVERSSRRVSLTAAGEVLRERARDIVDRVAEATLATRERAAGRGDVVSVGYNFAAGQYVLPAVLGRMNTMAPEVAVLPTEMRSGPQLAALADGSVDVALVYGRPEQDGVSCRFVGRVALVAIVGSAHRWFGRERVAFRELADQACITCDRQLSPAAHDAITAGAVESGITLRVEEELNDPNGAAMMASVRPLVGFASAPRAAHAAAAPVFPRVAAVRLHDPVPTVDQYVAWRADDQRLAVRTLLRCVESVRLAWHRDRTPDPRDAAVASVAH